MSILLLVKVNIYSYVNQSHECVQNIAVGAIYREINPSPTVCACEKFNRNGRPANVLGRRHRQITPRDATIHRARSLTEPSLPLETHGSFRSARYVPAPPAATRPDCSLTRPRPRGPAAGHEEFKRTLAPRRAYTFRLCDYDRRRRVPRVPTQLCAAPRCPPAPLDGSIPAPRDPREIHHLTDHPPAVPPPSRSPGISSQSS